MLISHAYSIENKGDAALLDVLVSDIRRQYGEDTQIDILTIDKIEAGATFSGVLLHEAFMYYALNLPKNRIGKLLYALWMMSYTNAWALTRRSIKLPLPKHLKDVADLYTQADLVITVGGGYFRTSGDFVTFVNLLLMLHPLRFAEILAKPTYLYTMSVGPFYHDVERWLVKRRFRSAGLILIREDTSLKLLKDMGITANAVRSVDSGFLFDSKESVRLREKLNIEGNQELVGVTARKWLDVKSQEAYETELASALDTIIDRHHVQVVFIPQVTSVHNSDDDRHVSRSIAARMQHASEVHVMEDEYTHYDVKAMYDELDYIIGTRFHSVIFSLTSYVPAIAIEYEHKTSGIMRDLNLSKWTLKIEDVRATKITELFDDLTQQKQEYVTHLKAVLPSYIQQAQAAIKLVDEAYRARDSHSSNAEILDDTKPQR